MRRLLSKLGRWIGVGAIALALFFVFGPGVDCVTSTTLINPVQKIEHTRCSLESYDNIKEWINN